MFAPATAFHVEDDGVLQTIGNVRIAPSVIHGRGLFTTQSRAADETVTVLDGQLVRFDVSASLLWDAEWNAVSTTFLLVRALRTSYALINHARHGNLLIDADGRTIRTRRPIEAGEEFTLNYLDQPLPAVYLADPRGAYLRV